MPGSPSTQRRVRQFRVFPLQFAGLGLFNLHTSPVGKGREALQIHKVRSIYVS